MPGCSGALGKTGRETGVSACGEQPPTAASRPCSGPADHTESEARPTLPQNTYSKEMLAKATAWTLKYTYGC